MIMAEEERFLKARQAFEQLIEFVQQAEEQDLRIDLLERETLALLLKVGYELLQDYIGRCGDGDAGETLPEQDRTLRRLEERRDRRYVSIFGEHHVRRYVYAVREGQKIERVPVDEQLGLPEDDFSYVLQDWLQRFCIKESFEEASTSLETLLGLRVCVRSGEHMNQHLAEHAEAFRVAQPPPDAEQEAELVVYANDCKGVPMRRPLEERLHRGPRRGKGEKANKKQMACVGAAYSVERYVRTADDILDEVFREARAQDRPRPQNKRLWAEMTRVRDGESYNGKSRVFVQQALDLQARDPTRRKTVICLMDGEKALRNEQHQWLPRALGVLDIWHVMERLWAVAHCFHPEGSPAAERFVEDRLRALLEGQVGYVIGYFRRLLATPPKGKKLTASQRRTIHSAITYFENNRGYMKYDEYLAAGYPIGSGMAEGACRHVVKDRLELTGMRWTLPGAQSMLHLRAIYLNDDWNAFLDSYIETEQARLYRKPAA
jgi:hypothetical protein